MTKPRRPKVKPLPTLAWAAISNDVPPEIWFVRFHRDDLTGYLRKIRVLITPVEPKEG